MSDYTPTAQWATNRPVLDDGDPPDAATWRQSLEDIYDRLEYHHEKLNVALLANQFVRYARHPRPAKPADWDTVSASGVLEQTSSSSRSVWYDLDLPHGCVLDDVNVSIDPANGHGALPSAASLPEWELYRVDSAGTATLLHSETDSSGNVSTYEAGHTIDQGGTLAITIDAATYAYRLHFIAEGATNFVAGLRLRSVTLQYTMTATDPGAA